MKITKEEFLKLYSKNISKKDHDEISNKIDQRFSEIVNFIQPNHKWFDYGNCDYDSEQSGGWFDQDEYKEEIKVGGVINLPGPFSIDNSIPTRYLWEDFKEDVVKQKEKYKIEKLQKKEKDKNKREERKQNLLRLQAIIKTKLTPEELKAITFKK